MGMRLRVKKANNFTMKGVRNLMAAVSRADRVHARMRCSAVRGIAGGEVEQST